MNIIHKLRSNANIFYEYQVDNGALLKEAADHIQALEYKLNAAIALKEALDDIQDIDTYLSSIAREAMTNFTISITK